MDVCRDGRRRGERALVWRSALFVPANSETLILKASACDADAVILDLEDGVSPEEKAGARLALRDHIGNLVERGICVAVRINSTWRAICADLEAAVVSGVVALIVPKVEESARLSVISDMLDEWERERGLAPHEIRLIAMIETPRGLAAASSIAAVSRVAGLALGTEDFSLALGVPPTPQMLALPVQQVAMVAAERGLMALAVPISIANYRDEEGWCAAAKAARSVGATGALCIHPKQVVAANAAFAPSLSEIQEAKAILMAWANRNEREGGVISLAGRMIDLPVVQRARRILSLEEG